MDLKFSVIIPVYNRPVLLRRALLSCVNQSYKNVEIIVIDDCSAIPVEDICKNLGDDRIQCIRNNVNLGFSESRNLGLALSTGDYLSFLDSDDVLSLDKFSRVADFIDSSGADIVINSQYRVLSSLDDFFCVEILPDIQRVKLGNLAENMFRTGDFIQANSYTVKREIAASKRFDKRYGIWDDSQYILSCTQVAENIQFLNEPLSVFFDLADPTRASQNRSIEQHEDMLKYLSNVSFGRAPIYFRALAVSDSIFYADPLSAVRFLWSGIRNGVSTERSLFYLFRCIVGFGRAKSISIAIKAFAQRLRGRGNSEQQTALRDLLMGRSSNNVSGPPAV
ncbi:glycosyltransferase family 2 protein [Rhizobium sp. TH2]|uniref:glycosyltransferase family 2 protein n=1 Tax=Rhizobium sp. TH2 TaxID=2775403 RepID=UPI00215864A2|nr:glycosyltransferase family 2 protein [Rhizobium sp. TH2]UVC11663.1 glycosyltransferase family 2 protein [Rhizobium sp. TH2]